jgi:hypothetical protein
LHRRSNVTCFYINIVRFCLCVKVVASGAGVDNG